MNSNSLLLLSSIQNNIYKNFIEDQRYLLYLRGVGNTVLLSLAAALFGVVIGVALTYFKLSKFKPLNWFANVYLSIIRGTPSFTQLLVVYFVIFASVNVNKILVGAIAFGINSGAYVSEIIRAGILSVDTGQNEAGRSLGLTNVQTMRFIIMPQAVKNILPALANEFIVLVKETAVVGYIPVMDLTKAATIVQSRTYNATFPLLGSAVIYFTLIKILTFFFEKMEKKLRKGDSDSR